MKQIVEINLTGGSRIGKKNATYPFATLIVNKNKLILSVSIIGHFEFESKDIILIEEYKLIPLLGQGIRIFHRIPKYNSKIIFWTNKEPSQLINQIQQTGFLDNTNKILSEDDLNTIKRLKQKEFPINPIAFLVLFFLIFSIFTNSFLFFPFKDGGFEIIMRFIQVFSGIIAISTLLTTLSPKLQKVFIVKDRSFYNVRKSFILITILSSIIFIISLFLFNFNIN